MFRLLILPTVKALSNTIFLQVLNVKLALIIFRRKTNYGHAIYLEILLKVNLQLIFQDANQYMKDGILLRELINKIDEVKIDTSDEIHALGDIY